MAASAFSKLDLQMKVWGTRGRMRKHIVKHLTEILFQLQTIIIMVSVDSVK